MALCGPQILPHEGGAGRIERRHNIVDNGIGIGRRGIPLHHDGIEGIDSPLNKEVGNGKNGILESGRNTEPENTLFLGPVHPVLQIPQTEGAVIPLPPHMDQNKHRRHILRDDAGECNAVLRHAADDDKKQVEKHIQNTRNHEIGQRAPGISVGAEHAVAEIKNPESRHSECINPKIEYGSLDKIVFGTEQLQHKPRRDETKHHNDAARCKAEHK